MKATTFIGIVAAMLVAPCGGQTPEPNGPAGSLTIWPMVGDQVAELRVGWSFEALEAYVAPRFDKTLASEGDVATDLRFYGLYNALDTAMVAHWIDGELVLPEGRVYGGIFGGPEFADDRWEFGWLVGSRVTLGGGGDAGYELSWATEYQRPWHTWREYDDAVYTGPCYRW